MHHFLDGGGPVQSLGLPETLGFTQDLGDFDTPCRLTHGYPQSEDVLSCTVVVHPTMPLEREDQALLAKMIKWRYMSWYSRSTRHTFPVPPFSKAFIPSNERSLTVA